jgi:hypothetical protein
MLPKQFNYLTFSICFWSITICHGDVSCEILFTFFLPHLFPCMCVVIQTAVSKLIPNEYCRYLKIIFSVANLYCIRRRHTSFDLNFKYGVDLPWIKIKLLCYIFRCFGLPQEAFGTTGRMSQIRSHLIHFVQVTQGNFLTFQRLDSVCTVHSLCASHRKTNLFVP